MRGVSLTAIRVTVLETLRLRAMTAPTPDERNQLRSAHGRSITAGPVAVRGLPGALALGAGTALRLDGALDPGLLPLRRLRVRFGDLERDVDGFALAESQGAKELLWWSLVPVPLGARPGPTKACLLADGPSGTVELPLGEVRVEPAREPPVVTALPDEDGSRPLIAICMATYEPGMEWLARQLGSIRAQTWERWVCLISDDASSPAASEALQRAVGGDPRFAVSRSEHRLGFYGNFERALGMVPADAAMVAMADQDDRWDPDKLEALAATLAAHPDAGLAYSDMRIVDEGGRLLSDTFWYLRRNRCDDVASMLIANTVTGAASLFRRELLETALPFPPGGTSEHYHDQWLALCSLALGEIAYLDRPTYDYTRHGESVTIVAAAEWYLPPRGLRERVRIRSRRLLRRLRMGLGGPIWRDMYLDRILMIRQLVAVIELRAGERIRPGRRRALGRLADADSPRSAAWLALRLLRPLIGRNETLARERVLVGALLWRAIVVRRARRRR